MLGSPFGHGELAKCETVVALRCVGSPNARLSSLWAGWGREMPDSRRFGQGGVAKCETLVAVG